MKEGRAGEICAYPSGLDKQLKTTGPFLLFSVAEGGDSATRWMAARTELHAGKIRGQKTLFVISRYSQHSPLFCFEFRGFAFAVVLTHDLKLCFAGCVSSGGGI